MRWALDKNETREERSARIHATKDHGKKRELRARVSPKPETEASKARKAVKVIEAARKVFEKWVTSPKAQAAARENSYYFARFVASALKEILEDS